MPKRRTNGIVLLSVEPTRTARGPGLAVSGTRTWTCASDQQTISLAGAGKLLSPVKITVLTPGGSGVDAGTAVGNAAPGVPVQGETTMPGLEPKPIPVTVMTSPTRAKKGVSAWITGGTSSREIVATNEPASARTVMFPAASGVSSPVESTRAWAVLAGSIDQRTPGRVTILFKLSRPLAVNCTGVLALSVPAAPLMAKVMAGPGIMAMVAWAVAPGMDPETVTVPDRKARNTPLPSSNALAVGATVQVGVTRIGVAPRLP